MEKREVSADEKKPDNKRHMISRITLSDIKKFFYLVFTNYYFEHSILNSDFYIILN